MKIFFFSLAGGFGSAQRRARTSFLFSGLSLLLFDGFAFPTSCHFTIIVPSNWCREKHWGLESSRRGMQQTEGSVR